MKIEKTEFGSITVDGVTYEHDIVITAEGKVEKRKKKLSEALYGTSHIISLDEARSVYENGVKRLIIGTGQYDNVRLSEEAEAYIEQKGCKVLMEATPKAIKRFNEEEKKKIGLFHVTC